MGECLAYSSLQVDYKRSSLQLGLQVGGHLALTDFGPEEQQWTFAYSWHRRWQHYKYRRGYYHYIIIITIEHELTGLSTVPLVCCASACRSIIGVSSTILWTDICMNSSNESSCWRTRPFSSKYELMTIQHASCHRSGVTSAFSSSSNSTQSHRDTDTV